MSNEDTPKGQAPLTQDSSTETEMPPSEPHDPYVDPYQFADDDGQSAVVTENLPAAPAPAPPPPPVPPVATDEDEEEPDEEGMLRMSFLGHLEELRSRLLQSLAGMGIAFLGSLIFAKDLWRTVSAPAISALRTIGAEEKLAQLTPMDAFTTIYFKLPLLASVFLASPWLLYQVWAFIAPGLYKRERRWAAPFVLVSAGLFILGGLFAYFVAFRFGLTFLLGIGMDANVKPVVSLVDYFDLFVNVTLGLGLLFEMPVLIFFLTLLRIVTPAFLIRNSRYAILIITVVAAILTPTPDIVNLMIFAVPMILLFFVGVFAGWILVLHRAGRKGVLMSIWLSMLGLLIFAGGAVALAVLKFGYHFTSKWPFLVR